MAVEGGRGNSVLAKKSWSETNSFDIRDMLRNKVLCLVCVSIDQEQGKFARDGDMIDIFASQPYHRVLDVDVSRAI